HIQRTATVTEIFAPVTGRMLAAPANSAGMAVDMVSAASLGGVSASAPAAVLAPPKIKTRTKEAGFQVLVGSAQTLRESLEAGAVGAILAFADAAPTA